MSRHPSLLSSQPAAPDGAELLRNAAAGGSVAAVPVKIVRHPGHLGLCKASHLLNAESEEYWSSLEGRVKNQAFVFEAKKARVLTRITWKDFGDATGVAALLLEAQVGKSWQELACWDAERTAEVQFHELPRRVCSSRWRLTFICNHGQRNDFIHVQSVEFFAESKLAAVEQTVRVTEKMWMSRAFTDVEVIVGEQRFPTHKAVLAAASPVFARMMASGMQEAQVGEIRIEDADEQSVQAALEYVYTGKVSEGAGFGVVLLGHKYDIQGLIEDAAPVALANVTPENAGAEVRLLRPHAEDPLVGPFVERLLDALQANRDLLRGAVLGR